MADGIASRARVVMIVDNAVDGDSRVQKVALSVADAGYDAVLIGRSPTGRREEYDLGGARVIRLPQPNHLLAHPRRNPGYSLRWPLAYANRDTKSWRRGQVEMLRRDLDDRRASLAIASSSGPSLLLRRAGFHLRRAYVLGRYGWHGLRSLQFNRGIAARTVPTGLLDTAMATSWRVLRGRGAWRRLDWQLTDFELAFGPEIDKLRPDLIHAHDFRMVGIAVRAAARAHGAGRRCAVVYDAHEFMPGVRAASRRWRIANEAHELHYVHQADAVTVVVPKLGDMLRERHHLREQPTVVMNAPTLATRSRGAPDVRRDAGVGPGAPLLVYAGSPAEQRGLATVVDALAQLPDVHAALILPGRPPAVLDLEKRALKVGVADRVHLLDYVEQDQVVGYVATADIGLAPFLHQPNHEIAIATKYLDYAQARMPVVVSDCEAQAELTRDIGNGEVFVAGDIAAFAAAVTKVLADLPRYRAAYNRPGLLESWTWSAQADVLLALYDRLLAREAA